jgi:2-keto-4-pentenoate hydratase/2-oxohepta-3-ene-1,7-dioic acid hydratase in catechol pathway
MRIARYLTDQGEAAWGVVAGDQVRRLEPHPFGQFEVGPVVGPLDQVRLLAPTRPSKIIAVGLNYRSHAAEVGAQVPEEPLLFFKPPSAVIGPEEPIVRPPVSQRVDYEGELAVVIGRRAKNVSVSEAMDYVLGYTCANDVTARDLQARDDQWTRAKGFDTFCPLGPWIETELDPADLRIETRVNGQVRQSGRTSDLVFGVPQLISYISQVMTLEPRDVILTGTPVGIGPLQPGDVVEVEISGIGVLRNPVR